MGPAIVDISQGFIWGPLSLPCLWRPTTHHHMLLRTHQNYNPDLIWEKLVAAMKISGWGQMEYQLDFGSLWPDCLIGCRQEGCTGPMIVDQTFLAIVFGSAMYQLVSRVLSNCILVKCVVRCVLDCFVQCFQPLSDENFPIRPSSS